LSILQGSFAGDVFEVRFESLVLPGAHD
jgi:hypothetical protein